MSLSSQELLFLKLVSNSIHQRNDAIPQWDHSSLFTLAKQHGLWPMVYDHCRTHHLELMLDSQHEDKIFASIIYKQTLKIQILQQLLTRFKNANIDFALLKGVSLSHLYPKPLLRISSDTDIVIKTDDLVKATALLEDFGVMMTTRHHLSHHSVGVHHDLGKIELHDYLYDPYIADHWFNSVSRFEELQIESQPTIIGSVPLLTPQFQLEYLFFHFLKHFLNKGVGLRQLIDLCLYIQDQGHLIDWNEFKTKLEARNLLVFFLALINVSNHYLGFDIHPLPQDDPNSLTLLEEFMSDIVTSGSFGHDEVKRSSFNRILDSNLNYESSKTVINPGIKSIPWFPSLEYFNHHPRYGYVIKKPYLLGLVWLHRWTYGVFSRLISPQKMLALLFRTPFKKTKFVQKRLELMKQLKIKIGDYNHDNHA
jgi:hypothetical protein